MKFIIALLVILLAYHFLGPAGMVIALVIIFLVQGSRYIQHSGFTNTTEAQRIFFEATFTVMGYIAKADGHISEREIQMARSMMDRLNLNEADRQRAIEAFTRGKQPDFNLDKALQQLKQSCHYAHLLKLFLELQTQAAHADGNINPEKQRILNYIATHLGLSYFDFNTFESIFRHYTQQSQQGYYQHQQNYTRPAGMGSNEAYRILGIEAAASDAEVKRAYRKLMSQNHPDKLVSKGLPEDMIKLATEKTQQIQKAYEIIKQARGM